MLNPREGRKAFAQVSEDIACPHRRGNVSPAWWGSDLVTLRAQPRFAIWIPSVLIVMLAVYALAFYGAGLIKLIFLPCTRRCRRLIRSASKPSAKVPA